MELGTQDIFLEKKKKGQQQDNGVLDIAAALARGLTKDAKRTAIINVSKKAEDLAALQAPSSPRFRLARGDDGPAAQPSFREEDTVEPLDEQIGLPELRQIVARFVNFFGPTAEVEEISFRRRMSRLQSKLDEFGEGGGTTNIKELRIRQQLVALRNQHVPSNPFSGAKPAFTQQDLENMVTLPPIAPNMKLRLNQDQFVRVMRDAMRDRMADGLGSVTCFTPTPPRYGGGAVGGAATLKDDDFVLLFQGIDQEHCGTIDWDDFTTYLMSQTRDRSRSGKASSEYATTSTPSSCPVWHQHEGTVSVMLVHPRTGVVLTGGTDGAVHSWEGNTLRHLRLITQCKSWVVDMKYTNNEQKILVICLDRQLLILDSRNGDVLRLYRGRHLVESDTGVNYAHETIPVVTIGERIPSYLQPKGAKVGANRSEEARKSALHEQMKSALSYEQFQKLIEDEKKNRTEKRKLEEFALAGMTDTPSCLEYHCSALGEEFILVGMSNGSVRIYMIPVSHLRIVRKHHVMQLHTDRVRQLKVVPFLDGVLSCSDDATIKLTSLESGQLIKSYSKLGHETGVSSFAFSLRFKMLVSCAMERNGLVWDYLQESPIARLEPHTCPTLGCAINDADGHIITVGIDNSVMVFDARSCRLLQSFHERRDLFSICAFDTSRMRLICATNYPVMYQLKKMISTFPHDYFGHTAPVTFTVYNDLYGQLLTIDSENLAMTWKVELGESIYTFRLAAFSSLMDDVRLTACKFDHTKRRVITGFHNGVIGVWNFSNGQAQNLIRSARIDDAAEREVTAVTTLMRGDVMYYIGAVGRLLVYQEESQQYTITEPPTWLLDEDLGIITSLTQVGQSLVACGCSGGAVVIFSLLTECQDGLVLWPEEEADHESNSTGHSTQNSAGLSRVTHLFPLTKPPYHHLFFAIHADSKLVLWHSFRRLFLSSEFLGHRQSSVSISHIVFSEAEQLITTADELGNVFMWTFELEEMSENEIGAIPRAEEEMSPDGTPFRIKSFAMKHQFHAQTNAISAMEVVVLDEGVYVVIAQPNNVTRIFDSDGACMGDFGFARWRSLCGSPKKAPVSPITVELDRTHEATQSAELDLFTPNGGLKKKKKPLAPQPPPPPNLFFLPPSPGPKRLVPQINISCSPEGGWLDVSQRPSLTPVSPLMCDMQLTPARPSTTHQSSEAVTPRRAVRVGGPKHREGIVKPRTITHHGSVEVEGLSRSNSIDVPRTGSEVGMSTGGGLLQAHERGSGRAISGAQAQSSAVPKNALSIVPVVMDEAQKSNLMANHLQAQLGRLRSCKTNLTEELKRVEQRIQATRRDHTVTSAREDEDIISQLPWTSRVSSRLHVTQIDEIRPPEGSKAYEEDNRRNARLRAAGAGKEESAVSTAKHASGGQNVRSDMFPSVTAPNVS